MNKKTIEWTDLALQDLDLIYSYISKDSLDNAKKIVEEILGNIDELILFPEKGRIIPKINKSYYREIFVAPYRIMYKNEEKSIFIVGVIHMATDFTPDKLHKRRI